MPISVSDPPPGTWIEVGHDEQGWPRLRWAPPFNWNKHLVRCALGCGFAALVGYFAVYPLIKEMLRNWADLLGGNNQGGKCWQIQVFLVFITVVRFILLPLVTASVAGLALYCGWVVYVSLHVRTPDQLTLGPEALHYEFEGPLRLRRKVRKIPRADLVAVRLGRGEGRQRLTVDLDPGSVEVGKYLREMDRTWLAGVLRTWLAERPAPAPGPAFEPPPSGAITVEHDEEGRVVIRWRGIRPAKNLARWGAIGEGIAGLFVGSMCVGLLLFLIVIPILTGLWAGKWSMTVQVVTLVIVFAWLSGWVSAGLGQARRFWLLLLGPTPASLILTPESLRYDPGRYFDGKKVHSGRRCEIPLAEMGKILLERVEVKQRLTVDHGAERIEIGPALEDQEREWLAGVLRAWAK